MRSALEDEDADDDEDSDTKKTVKVTLEELLAHPFVRHRMADYVKRAVRRAGGGGADQGREGSLGIRRRRRGRRGLAGGGRGRAPILAKVLEKRRKELRAEMGEDDKRRNELVKTTGTGKPSKGSIDWMRAQGIDVRGLRPSLPRSKPRRAAGRGGRGHRRHARTI